MTGSARIEGCSRKKELDVTVRYARREDVAAIGRITKLAFEDVSQDKIEEAFFGTELGGKPWHEYKCARVSQFCLDHLDQVIVAETGGRVVGYATYYADRTKAIAEIADNAVHPEFQGRGIGTLLQRELNRIMLDAGFTRFKVSTCSNDIAAQRVYEKLGFERCSEIYHYLRKL